MKIVLFRYWNFKIIMIDVLVNRKKSIKNLIKYKDF